MEIKVYIDFSKAEIFCTHFHKIAHKATTKNTNKQLVSIEIKSMTYVPFAYFFFTKAHANSKTQQLSLANYSAELLTMCVRSADTSKHTHENTLVLQGRDAHGTL